MYEKVVDKLTPEEREQLRRFRIETAILTLQNVYSRNKGEKLLRKKKRRAKSKKAKKSRSANR